MVISTEDKDTKIYYEDYIGEEIAVPKKRISSVGTILTFLRRGT